MRNRIPSLIQYNGKSQSKGDNYYDPMFYHPAQEFAVLYSNTDGFRAWGNKDGSFLIRAMCDILGNDKFISEEYDFCKLVKMIRHRTMILSKVVLKDTMQCIELHETLTHNVYFRTYVKEQFNENENENVDERVVLQVNRGNAKKLQSLENENNALKVANNDNYINSVIKDGKKGIKSWLF